MHPEIDFDASENENANQDPVLPIQPNLMPPNQGLPMMDPPPALEANPLAAHHPPPQPPALDQAPTIPDGNAILDDETIMDDEKARTYAKALQELDEDRQKMLQKLQDIEAARKPLENQLKTHRENLFAAFRQRVEEMDLDQVTYEAWQ